MVWADPRACPETDIDHADSDEHISPRIGYFVDKTGGLG